jgi:PKD repeat protein
MPMSAQQFIPQQQQQVQPQPAFQNRPAPMPGQVPGQPVRPGIRPLAAKPGGPDPRKLILGCLGVFFFALLLFIIFVLVYVSQVSAGDSGLASTLGVDPAQFTNTLILLTNLIFGAVVMVTFFVGVFGLFRGSMAPKTDKPARSKGFRQAGIAGAIFLVVTLIWVFVFLYLNGKTVNLPTTTQQKVQGFLTDPEVTTTLTAPVDIKFDASKMKIPANLEITFYQWDFGDGTSSTTPAVTHTYRDIGQYNVKLTVTARNKTTNETLTDSFDKLVTVIDVKISAEFTATPETGPAPLTVAFDASASQSPAGEITSYDWDFKGQNTFKDAQGATTEYTFNGEGEYEVKLRVTDNTGKTAIVSKKIIAGGPDVPIAVIDIPTTDGKYYVGKQLTFLGEKSTSPNGDINKYEWDFGDGSPKANTRTATHTYKTAGLYEVILKVTDETDKTAQSAQKITLATADQSPTAVIETDPPLGKTEKSLSGRAPFEVSFDANKSTDPNNNIVEYKWDFEGKGTEDAAGPTATYVYKTPGTYNAKLTAVDATGLESSAILVVKVLAQDLVARLTADKLEGTQPLMVTFDASSSSYPDGQITSFEWDFGDGSAKQIGASQITYNYTSIGTFTASVVAKASDGKTAKGEIVINVRPVSLQACFNPSTLEAPAPVTVEFDPRCTQGAAAKYLWDFGDGTSSRTRKPTHEFAKAGSYQVTLEVTDNQNVVSKFSKDILVTGAVQ